MLFIMLTVSACNNAAGTYVWNADTTKDQGDTTTIDWVLKLEGSGKYTLTQVLTSDFKDTSAPPPMETPIEAGTWTLDGDKVTLKPKTVAELANAVEQALGQDPNDAEVGTLNDGGITMGDAKYLKQ